VICAGESYDVSLPGPPYQYEWNDGSTEAQRFFSEAGTYSVITSLNGCESTETFEVSITPLPEFDLGPAQAICSGEAVVLNIDLPGAAYLWSNGKTTKQITVSTAGTYSATATLNNCSFTDNVTVTVSQNPAIVLNGPDAMCDGETGQITASLGNFEYLWNNGSTQNSISINKSGRYSVVAVNPETGCSSKASIQIGSLPQPGVNLAETLEICKGKSKIITAIPINNSKLLWDDGSTLTTYEIAEAGSYAVTATTTCGSVTKSIVVTERDCSQTLNIPNSFTPDGDGLNDIFRAVGQRIKSFKISIFNSWGEIVFESEDIREGWNGSFRNNSYFVESGLYPWILQVEYEDGYIEVKRGNVNLIR